MYRTPPVSVLSTLTLTTTTTLHTMLTHTTFVLAVLSATGSLASARMERVERQGQQGGQPSQLAARTPIMAEDPIAAYDMLKRSTFDPLSSQLETRSASAMAMPMSFIPEGHHQLVARKHLTSAQKKAAKKAKCAAKKKKAAAAAALKKKKAAATKNNNVNLSVKAASSSSSSPNGAESFLNNGINGGGWKPPYVSLGQLKSVSIEQALASNSVWAPCKPFKSLFEKHGNANGIPPIMLAAFAMQESTCNPNAIGDNGGAVGLMQMTVDNCADIDLNPKACADPDRNIKGATALFAGQVKAAGGNVLVALGQYNGWFTGMTLHDATKAAKTDCCVCQNNLDYLDQMLNGWMMGKTGYEIGTYKNLDVCGDQS